MSITVTTDVFCDVCNNWTDGCSSSANKIRRKSAREAAKRAGWKRIRVNGSMRDLCPGCANLPIDELEEAIEANA